MLLSFTNDIIAIEIVFEKYHYLFKINKHGTIENVH